MSEKPTIEQYKAKITEQKFQAYKCIGCGVVITPPSGTCYGCGSSDMEWIDVSGKGTLVSFTVIHIAPDDFADEAPYYVAIIELEEGSRVTCRLDGFDPLKPEEISLGIPVVLTYITEESGRTYLAFKPE
ncbi:MAG: nucleic acid-binding protein [Candidatus Lokiarchaeota archaeon]|nr:nucleic acid-binding protein [Candidatus Lokiarchaeota archaeon]